MLLYPNIDPIAIQVGPIQIYWYGIMYLLGFTLAWLLAKLRVKKLHYDWNNEFITDFIFYSALGTILGGRIGYVLIYEFTSFLHNPFILFKFWLGGMSFHGGLIGSILGIWYFAHKTKISLIRLFDFAAPLAPLGLGLGRIGNFINSELWGRITNLPWGIVFPNGGSYPRHPSQIYEALLEGLLLFLILWFYSNKKRIPGKVSALFFISYGIIRFCCEFLRQPDKHIGFIAFNWLTMGQLLSIPMILVGITILIYIQKKRGKLS